MLFAYMFCQKVELPVGLHEWYYQHSMSLNAPWGEKKKKLGVINVIKEEMVTRHK